MNVLLYQTSCYFHVVSDKLLFCLYYSRFFVLIFLKFLHIWAGYTHQNYHKHHFHWQLLSNSHSFGSFGHPLLLYLFFFFSYIFLVLADCLHLCYHSPTSHFLLCWHPSYLGNKATIIQGYLPNFLKYNIILKSHIITWILQKFPIQNVALYNIYFHQYSEQTSILNYWNKHS